MKTPAKQKRRHRGFLRNERRIRYDVKGLNAALADPDRAGLVSMQGDLFPRLHGKSPTGVELTNALHALEPDTGRALRARVNAGTRKEGETVCSNVCHGLDLSYSVDKSVSVAAVYFGDRFVVNAAAAAAKHETYRQTKRADRRLRKNGQNETIETGLGLAFVFAELVGRLGQPQLHFHQVFPNLTAYEEDGRRRYCAVNLLRIARSHTAAQRRMNLRLFKYLRGAGYNVELVGGVCRLPSVPKEICERFSPVSAMLRPDSSGDSAAPRRASASRSRRLEDEYLKHRPKKTYNTLAEARAELEKVLSLESFQALRSAYYNNRLMPATAVASGREFPARSATVVDGTLTRNVAFLADDDALQPVEVAHPYRKALGKILATEVPAEMRQISRTKCVELVYTCPENRHRLVDHTDVMRTALRLIFPRMLIHQRFSKVAEASFTVSQSTGNLAFDRLLLETATELENELGQPQIAHCLPSVLRWLHCELASRTIAMPKFEAPAVQRSRPQDNAPRDRTMEQPQPSRAAQVVTVSPQNQAGTSAQEVEMLP